MTAVEGRGVSGLIVDPFAGPGGWSEGLRMLGLADVGIEWDAAACATRAAAGHLTIRADVATYPPERFVGAGGCIFSPPCPDWSVAGKRAGRAGTSGYLIDLVPAWVETIRPRWVACEQVPPCLPIWQEHAARYRELGYSTWCGILNAADYGVPQTRQRAFLLASLDRPATPPEPTHCRGGGHTMFGILKPWVSMADALGWGLPAEPSPVVMTARNRQTGHDVLRGSSWRAEWFQRQQDAGNWVVRTGANSMVTGHTGSRAGDGVDSKVGSAWRVGAWPFERPATTIAGDPRWWPPGHKVNAEDQRRHADANERYGDRAGTDAIRLTLAQALTLQSFRPDYPVQGTKTKQFEQVGNAVPPLLAAHVLAAVTGRALDLEVAA